MNKKRNSNIKMKKYFKKINRQINYFRKKINL